MNAPLEKGLSQTGAEPAGNGLMDLRGAGADDAAAAIAGLPGQGKFDGLRKLMTSQALVVVIVVAVSAGSLLFMRRYGVGATMDFSGMELNYEPAKSSFSAAEQRRILTELERSATPLAISAESVKSNPFYLELTEDGADPVTAVDPASDLLREQQRREEEIRMALANLTLNGVMGGPVPLARVNGKTVRVGDTIDELFLVARIHDRAVDLIVDKRTYTISMSESGSGGGPRGGLRANPMLPRK